MEIKKSNDNNTIQLNKDDVSLIISNNFNEYFRIETEPHEDKVVSFSLASSFLDTKQHEVFETFKKFLQNFIGGYYMYGEYNRHVVVNPEEHYIALQGEGRESNILKIEYSYREIIIRIYHNPKNNDTINNCVILDKSGALSGHYFWTFMELLNSLVALAERNVDAPRTRTPKKPFFNFKKPF